MSLCKQTLRRLGSDSGNTRPGGRERSMILAEPPCQGVSYELEELAWLERHKPDWDTLSFGLQTQMALSQEVQAEEGRVMNPMDREGGTIILFSLSISSVLEVSQPVAWEKKRRPKNQRRGLAGVAKSKRTYVTRIDCYVMMINKLRSSMTQNQKDLFLAYVEVFAHQQSALGSSSSLGDKC